MQLLRWNHLNLTQGHNTRRASSVVTGAGCRESFRLPVDGEAFFLTSPFIDQAIALRIPPRRTSAHACIAQTVCAVVSSCGMGGRRHGQAQSQAELPSPIASSA